MSSDGKSPGDVPSASEERQHGQGPAGFLNAGVALMVEHLTCNQGVGGSSPFSGSKNIAGWSSGQLACLISRRSSQTVRILPTATKFHHLIYFNYVRKQENNRKTAVMERRSCRQGPQANRAQQQGKQARQEVLLSGREGQGGQDCPHYLALYEWRHVPYQERLKNHSFIIRPDRNVRTFFM